MFVWKRRSQDIGEYLYVCFDQSIANNGFHSSTVQEIGGHDTNDDGGEKMSKRHDSPSKCSTVVIETIRIAPSSTSEKNDRRAVQSRRRRERPQKLRLDTTGTDDEIRSLYEPDIDSFVSGCIPGVSVATGSSQRRARMTRQRSLPLLSYLASTQLAAAEKKRKKEETERHHVIASEEARKALLLNPIKPASGGSPGGTVQTNSIDIQKCSVAPMVSIKKEELSNILMPPLLASFLNQLK